MSTYSPLQSPYYVVVTGGVISGLGKGVLTASLAALFKESYSIVCIKCDGYLNADPGTINPTEHGEVYVLEDGGEVDMDFGHYERLIGIRARRDFNITMGKVYQQILENERRGVYLGKTVQLIPHATNEIKERIYHLACSEEADIVFIEIGGTVGDMENELFIEAIRQIRGEVKREKILFAHLTHIPIVEGSRELKSKPTQTSVKMLNRSGIYPDMIFCRSDREITDEIRNKISLYCNVPKEAVISNANIKDVNLLPEYFEHQGVPKLIEKHLQLTIPGLSPYKKQLLQILKKVINIDTGDPITQNQARTPILEKAATVLKDDMLEAPHTQPELGHSHVNIHIKHSAVEVDIAICGKYTKLEDSYASVREAILHAAVHVTEKLGKVIHPKISFFDVTEVVPKARRASALHQNFKDVSGVIVPGGFGLRGMEEKILIIKHAREHKLPFMGICLGMQLAVIEYARHVCGIENASSEEVVRELHNQGVQEVPVGIQHSSEPHQSKSQGTPLKIGDLALAPVIHLLEEQKYIAMVGGTMRLGARKVLLKPDSLIYRIYGQRDTVSERFRHRYEVNNAYITTLEKAGLVFSGMAPKEEGIMQVIELPQHPCFIGGQFHPELCSTLETPAPFFMYFMEAATHHALASA